MTRKKVKLACITNDSARKATYNKRKKGLIRKVSKLSTLCDVQACAIVYSPYHTQPQIWPPTLVEVHQAEEQFHKQKSNNKEKMVNNIVFNCLTGRISLMSLAPCDLDDIARVVDQQINDVDERLVEISRRASAGAGDGGSSAAAPGDASASNGVNMEFEVRLLQMIPVTNIGSDGGGVAVAPRRADYMENMKNLQRQLCYMELVNNNSMAALARTAVPMATEQ
ncbi:Agamous-like MADS-box protein AGL80 [Linum grandiflorum]